jgi:hypothetical protein
MSFIYTYFFCTKQVLCSPFLKLVLSNEAYYALYMLAYYPEVKYRLKLINSLILRNTCWHFQFPLWFNFGIFYKFIKVLYFRLRKEMSFPPSYKITQREYKALWTWQTACTLFAIVFLGAAIKRFQRHKYKHNGHFDAHVQTIYTAISTDSEIQTLLCYDIWPY